MLPEIGHAISMAKAALGRDWERAYRAGLARSVEDALMSVTVPVVSGAALP